jgi:cytochrome c peroxidase
MITIVPALEWLEGLAWTTAIRESLWGPMIQTAHVASIVFFAGLVIVMDLRLVGLSFTDTPWDRFLGGNDGALTARQLDGAQTFLSLKCSICHNGATFSDDQFHNVAVAQIGPGQGDGPTGRDDFGRMRVTGDQGDRYRFRTTPLRNVELTAPYMHSGQFTTLESVIAFYNTGGGTPVSGTKSPLMTALGLTTQEKSDLVAFMKALTGEAVPAALIMHTSKP